MAKINIKAAGASNRLHKVGAALAVLASLACGPAAIAQDAYHPAASPAELALKHVLDLDGQDGDVMRNLLSPGSLGALSTDYRPFLTKALLTDISRQYAVIRQTKCANRPHVDGYCDWLVDPIACSHDGTDQVFHTESQTAAGAVVTYKWKPDPAITGNDDVKAEYRLVPSGDKWMLDGISCHTATLAFNMGGTAAKPANAAAPKGKGTK